MIKDKRRPHMKISHYLLLFVGLFTIVPILAIGKRKQPEVSSGPTAQIRRVANETGRTVVLEIIDAENDWIDVMNILPGDQVINRNVPLSADPDVEHDLVRFDSSQQEEEDDEPVEQLFIRVARIARKIDHQIDIKVAFTLGIMDWSTKPATDSQILDTRGGHFHIPEHTFDHYIVDITLRGQDLAASSFVVEMRTTPE